MKGMNMKVERVTVNQVKDKFNMLKKKSSQKVDNFEEFEKKFEEKLQPT